MVGNGAAIVWDIVHRDLRVSVTHTMTSRDSAWTSSFDLCVVSCDTLFIFVLVWTQSCEGGPSKLNTLKWHPAKHAVPHHCFPPPRPPIFLSTSSCLSPGCFSLGRFICLSQSWVIMDSLHASGTPFPRNSFSYPAPQKWLRRRWEAGVQLWVTQTRPLRGWSAVCRVIEHTEGGGLQRGDSVVLYSVRKDQVALPLCSWESCRSWESLV